MFTKFTCLLAVCLIVSVSSFSQQIIIDTSFGTKGTVSIKNINEDLLLTRITAQHNGKIIAPFTSDEGGYADNGVVVRFTTDGEIDRTFGTEGYREVMQGVYNLNSTLCAVLVQPDDKILAYSNFYNRNSYEDTLFIERWLPNGKYDSSFGVNGIELLGNYGENPDLTFMAIKPDGHIVVTYAGSYNGYYGFLATELKPDGSIERNFGDHGFITLNSVDNSRPVGLTALPDNRIVIANQYPVGMQGFDYYYKDNLATYQANGKPDSSVGTNGVVYISDTTYFNFPVDMKPWQNKLYVYTSGISGNGQDVLIRYNANGTLDNTFGTNGKVYTALSPGYSGNGDFDIQQDGKIITALTGSATYRRYFTNGVQDLSFGTDGVATPKTKSKGTDFEIIQNHLYIASISISSGEGYAGLDVTGYTLVSPSADQSVSSSSVNAISKLALHPVIGIYPNPTTNIVTINGMNDGVHQVRVITQNGKLMSDATVAGISYQLNMSALANGIYFIQVRDQLTSTTFKVAKQ